MKSLEKAEGILLFDRLVIFVVLLCDILIVAMKLDTRLFIEEDVLDISVCNSLINFWGGENDLTWSSKREGDSVNPTCFYQLLSADINVLCKFEYLILLLQVIECRLSRIFPRNKFVLWECFVQKYWKDKNIGRKRNYGSMVGHVDGSEGTGDIASVVYTMHLGKICQELQCVDHEIVCIMLCVGNVVGGFLVYSNCDSGVLAEDDGFNATIQPNNNSLYMIMGSYVEHGVAAMTSGIRIAIVFFFKVNTEFDHLILLWNNKEQQCPRCLHCFVNMKTLTAHSAICDGVVSYMRFKKALGDNASDDVVTDAASVDINISAKNDNDDRLMKLLYFSRKQCYICHKSFITKRSLYKHRKTCKK
jgi:hypothetical protein